MTMVRFKNIFGYFDCINYKYIAQFYREQGAKCMKLHVQYDTDYVYPMSKEVYDKVTDFLRMRLVEVSFE